LVEHYLGESSESAVDAAPSGINGLKSLGRDL